VNIIGCGRCGYKGESEYSFVLCGEICPKCKAIIIPDFLREYMGWKIK
jgi:hypothetical protein